MIHQPPRAPQRDAGQLTTRVLRRDFTVAVALFAACVVYLVALPRNLGEADEALLLYEALRVLHGDVFYTDIYEIITPGAQYILAGIFGLFGTEFGVVRAAAAVLHGLIVVAIFAICRMLQVHRAIACVAAAAHIAVCQPGWPYVSPHWLTTLLTLLLLLFAIRRPSKPRYALVLGVITGIVILVQQQKGVVLVVCVMALLLVDHLVERRPEAGDSWRSLRPHWLHAALGAAVVAVPAFVFLTLRAGPYAILRALVVHPLTNYPNVNEVSWGSVSLLTGSLALYTFPTLLTYLPVVLLLVLVQAAQALRQGDREGARVFAAILVVGAFSVLSIVYHPDLIHLAFIAPVFFVAMAQIASKVLVRTGRPAMSSAAAWAVSLVLLMGMVVHLDRNLVRARADYPISRQTAFGRVDFRNRRQTRLIDRVEALLEGTPSRELFCYPGYPAMFLITGTKNPVPYQLFRPDYNDPDQVDHVLKILEERRVPLVVTLPAFLIGVDRVLQYIFDHYEAVDPTEDPPTVFRRVERSTRTPPQHPLEYRARNHVDL